jgi:hypothetical protein
MLTMAQLAPGDGPQGRGIAFDGVAGSVPGVT